MQNSQKLYSIQKVRAELFPKDRIAFFRGAAVDDQRTFRALAEGRMSLAEGCATVAKSNYLETVSEEQLINELKICGWI